MTNKTLIYYDDSEVLGQVTRKVLGTVLNPERVDFASDDFRDKLRRGQYDVVIDTSTIGKDSSERGAVSALMNTIYLENKPRVERIYSSVETLAEVVRKIEGDGE
jgi:hypothetical protein